MAVYKLFPTKDATIYSRYPTMNTGLDSIIEALADYSTGTAHVSRYFIQFDQTEINTLFTINPLFSNPLEEFSEWLYQFLEILVTFKIKSLSLL